MAFELGKTANGAKYVIGQNGNEVYLSHAGIQIKEERFGDQQKFVVYVSNMGEVIFSGILEDLIYQGSSISSDPAEAIDFLVGEGWVNFNSGSGDGTIDPQNYDLADFKNQSSDLFVKKSDLSLKADLVGGKVPASQLPNNVDDVVEGYYEVADGQFYEDPTYTNLITGEAGKIYIDLVTNNLYRWTGTIFANMSGNSSLYVGFLLRITTAPTISGLYRLLELGTYPNLAPAFDENGDAITITATSGVINEAYFDGEKWRKSNIQLPAVATVFNATNNTDPQGGKQISDWLFGQPTVGETYIETDIVNTAEAINIGLSSDAILTIIDTGRTTTQTISNFRFNGTAGLIRLIKYSKSGNNVTLVAYQDVTLNGSVVEVTPNSQMATLGTNEYYAIRMTSVANGLAGRIGFEAGATPTYDCYSNVTNSGYLPDTFTLGALFDNYKVGFNFDVSASTVSVFNDKFDERYDLKSNQKNKVYSKKINILGDSISTSSGGGNANLGVDKQYYGLMKTRDNCSIYVNAVAGASIVTGGQADTIDFTNDTRIASMTTNSPDIILIFGGINDFLQNLPLGTLGDTSKTGSFYGALDYLYKNVLTQNPNVRVFHMTPLHTTYSQGGGLIPEYNRLNYLSEYIDAIYKVARRYGVSIIDTNTLTGITCYNIASYADDLIHVKESGHELIYKAVINELNRML